MHFYCTKKKENKKKLPFPLPLTLSHSNKKGKRLKNTSGTRKMLCNIYIYIHTLSFTVQYFKLWGWACYSCIFQIKIHEDFLQFYNNFKAWRHK